MSLAHPPRIELTEYTPVLLAREDIPETLGEACGAITALRWL